ncbi:MAG: glycosyltransferase [Patescibacteria group bacterium]
MKQHPLVSIIIPAYNAANYVKEAIDSALSQIYHNIEIIVVDDGSTDDTKKILEPYVRGNKIKYIYQGNKGLSGARNTGIKDSLGEYVALLDTDDIFLPEKIEKQVEHLETDPACDVSYCDLYHFWDERPSELMKLNYRYYSGHDVLPNLLERSFIAPVTVVFRRKVFEKYGYFDEAIRQYAEDFEFWLRLSYHGANICFLPDILAKLRLRREGNIQGLSNQPKMKLTALKVVENLCQEMSVEDRLRYHIKSHLKTFRLKTAFSYAMVGDKTGASRFISEAFRDYPLGRVFSAAIRVFISIVPVILLRWFAVKFYYSKRAMLLRKV